MAAAPACAQSSATTLFNPRQDAKVHLGVVYLTPGFELTNLGVDTNVFNQAVDPQQDVTATLTPSLKTWLPMARHGLISGTFDAAVVYYQKFKDNRSINPGANVRAEGYLHHLTVLPRTAFCAAASAPTSRSTRARSITTTRPRWG